MSPGSVVPQSPAPDVPNGGPERTEAAGRGENPRQAAIVRERLHDLAHVARRASRSDGVVIALEREGLFVCRARAGDTAPDLGAAVDRDSGLSGQCIRTATTLVCSDSDTDPRVDAAVCRRLGIRSVAAIPLRCGSRTVGIFEAFAAEPHTYSDDAVRILERLAEAVLAAVADEYAPEPAPSAQEPAAAAPEPAPDATNDTGVDPAAGSVSHDEDLVPPPDFMPCPPVPEFLSSVPAHRSPPRVPWGRISSWARNHALLLLLLLALAAIVVGGLRAIRAASARARVHAASAPAPDPLRNAAEQGDSAAQYRLAVALENGNTPARDGTEFFEWLLKSANLGNADAQYELGNVLAQGKAVPQDLVAAYTWYLVAGLSGDARGEAAARNLVPELRPADIGEVRFHVGRMYASGIALPQDKANAYSWLTLAEAAGNQEASAEKQNLASQMSRKDMAAARRRASEWLARHGSSGRQPNAALASE